MDETEHKCEVCYINFVTSSLISVEGLAYQTWKRVSPWYICKDCADKISDALKEKEGKNE